ncbi:hypothetical protein HCJ93_19465 [Streptomyces sp. SBST2-5]|uniref:Tetratricopeptide repeat protein n=1 Tax=Streptomyces composti TaxID=2720025 RepID=A0ABX1AEB3_9ACTN|nr:hypothetical protein [Streptomyces composti]NJP52168.1 hypothetical protein [Streptomyces composti]
MAEGQRQVAAENLLTRIGQVVMLHHAGDREEARHRLLGLWTELGEHGDPVHRCTLARCLADTQDDPEAELAWDLRALTAAEEAGGGRTTAGEQAAAVRALYPALHLDLAADYARLGRPDAARAHLHRARTAARTLADDRYGAGVRSAIRRLELRLGEGEGGADGEGGGGGPVGPPRQRL